MCDTREQLSFRFSAHAQGFNDASTTMIDRYYLSIEETQIAIWLSSYGERLREDKERRWDFVDKTKKKKREKKRNERKS